jgi:hypothetical protein
MGNLVLLLLLLLPVQFVLGAAGTVISADKHIIIAGSSYSALYACLWSRALALQCAVATLCDPRNNADCR